LSALPEAIYLRCQVEFETETALQGHRWVTLVSKSQLELEPGTFLLNRHVALKLRLQLFDTFTSLAIFGGCEVNVAIDEGATHSADRLQRRVLRTLIEMIGWVKL
jgi:hypothetical protein